MKIQHNDKKLTLVQGPSIDDSHSKVCYTAKAIDSEENEYIVTWQCYENFEEIENEDEMCDWNKYTVRAI